MPLHPMRIKELLDEGLKHACDGYGRDRVCVKIAAIAELPSRFGDFQVIVFYNNHDDKEHAAFVHGDVCDSENIPIRLHSECLTGDAIGSLRCDCRDQLETSLKKIGEREKGVVLYLRQEVRGIGLVNKIRAYGLQDYGYDTVQANVELGFRDDEREYSVAAHMLDSLRIRSVQMMTNNPRKIKDLAEHGIVVTERIPLIIPPNPYNEFYLRTKAEKSGHLINIGGNKRLVEQDDRVHVEGMTPDQVEALNEA